MPCLEITMPQTTAKVRELLTSSLTTAFTEATGIPGDIFGILFHEYQLGQAATGGKLCANEDRRPYLHFILYCPRLKRTTKQKVIQAFTEAFTSGVGNPAWKPVIHLTEHPYDNVGVEGKLLSDSYEQCAKSKFYYELPLD